MTKIGLKLWNVNIDNYYHLAKKLYKEKLFDYIELYVVPTHSDKIKYWKDLDIPFDIHAPHSAHSMNLANEAKREYNKKLYFETKKYADELNARYIVFHGGIDGDYKEVAYQLKTFQDPRCLIENKPYKVLKFLDAQEYTGTKPNEIEYIKSYTNCGFCLDIGHAVCSANSFGVDPYAFIEDFRKLSPKKLHLSDINITTELDEHLNFGKGTLNFSKLKPLFKEVNDITIETQKKSKENLDDFLEDIHYIRGVINE